MNKTYNAHERKRKTASRRKKELALALAVSLWIASGGVASAQETTITADHTGSVYGNHDNTGWGTYTGDPNNNTVTMTGGKVTGAFLNLAGAYWGRDTEKTMSNNKLDISGGTIDRFSFLAGALTPDGDPEYNDVKTRNVTNNAVILGGTAQIGAGDIYGALTGTGNATGNSVAITGLAINVRDLFGGLVERNGNAENNTVTIIGGSVSCNAIYGGEAGRESGNAKGNVVTLENVRVTTARVAGGTADGTATHNTVSLTNSTVTGDNSTVTGDVYGGYTAAPGISGDFVTGNTLNLSGENTVSGTVKNFDTVNLKSAAWGTPVLTAKDFTNITKIDASGLAFTNPGDASGSTTLLSATSGLDTPTLTVTSHTQTYTNSPLVAGVTIDGTLTGNITNSASAVTYTLASNTVNKIAFGDVEWKDSGALMTRPTNITFAGANVDTSNINFTNLSELKNNETMTLVSDFGDTVGTITGTKYKVGSTLEGTGKASLSNGDLIFTTESTGPQEQTHNTVMGATVSMAALSAGNDFVGAATKGLSLASNAGADGVSSFAQMGGGTMRQETGSHVDTHTWNAILALGHQNKKERGTMEYGAFFEYGSGNYSTFNGDERGDGNMHYTGGGLLAKYTTKNSVYVEGSLRAGSVHDDARNVLRDVNDVPYSYETNAAYMGFHLGVGKEIAVAGGNAVDVYGKYFYNRRNGVSFDAGGHYDLDAVTSSVLRVGARYILKRNKWNFYAGAAYEHEFDGKANGTADGVAIRGADTSGASFRGEIGATVKPGENSPWSLDLNVAGFAGKKQGVTGGVSVSFMF